MHRIDPAALSRKNLALLVVFDVVAEMRSVTLAAERLSLSQPALSHSLGKLRLLFDDPLFVRGRGTLLLTPRAQGLVAPVRALLTNAETILRPARPDPASLDGDLRLAMSDACRLMLGDAVVRRALDLAPGVCLHVERLDSDSEARLADGTLDLLLGKDGVVPRGLRRVEVRRDRLVGVVDAAHPLAGPARANAVRLDDWIASPHIVVAMPGQIPDHVGAALAPLGVQRLVGARATSFVQALTSLAGSPLVAAVPARLVRAARPSMADLVSFDLPVKTPPVRQRLVWHPSTDGEPLHGWMRETLRAIARDGDAADAALASPLSPDPAAPIDPVWPVSRLGVGGAGDWPHA